MFKSGRNYHDNKVGSGSKIATPQVERYLKLHQQQRKRVPGVHIPALAGFSSFVTPVGGPWAHLSSWLACNSLTGILCIHLNLQCLVQFLVSKQ